MVESDSVIGKKQIYYVDGEAMKMSSDSEESGEDREETEKEKLKFSEDADRLIWLAFVRYIYVLDYYGVIYICIC